ncbi:hypothetical protein B0T24DRAFT_639816 [Lasiosphaeria ovina]|uniref:Uncharacterized protein n=1 Tax=Lasiosphaeria ovina TaxID=92902 RepID=A0AAE0JVW8_9PEZI|nr:hypothetical protein B0T24DRAFT_639816 [Lasiosphaeria ovina]
MERDEVCAFREWSFISNRRMNLRQLGLLDAESVMALCLISVQRRVEVSGVIFLMLPVVVAVIVLPITKLSRPEISFLSPFFSFHLAPSRPVPSLLLLFLSFLLHVLPSSL